MHDISKNWPDPTANQLQDPRFEKIWQKIKTWDIHVPGAYNGYCGTTGNHVRAVLDALDKRDRYKMNDMFKSWAYWRPIVKIVGTVITITSLILFGNTYVIYFLSSITVLSLVCFILHMIAKESYENYMQQIKDNYKKLTGKVWDED